MQISEVGCGAGAASLPGIGKVGGEALNLAFFRLKFRGVFMYNWGALKYNKGVFIYRRGCPAISTLILFTLILVLVLILITMKLQIIYLPSPPFLSPFPPFLPSSSPSFFPLSNTHFLPPTIPPPSP